MSLLGTEKSLNLGWLCQCKNDDEGEEMMAVAILRPHPGMSECCILNFSSLLVLSYFLPVSAVCEVPLALPSLADALQSTCTVHSYSLSIDSSVYDLSAMTRLHDCGSGRTSEFSGAFSPGMMAEQ